MFVLVSHNQLHALAASIYTYSAYIMYVYSVYVMHIYIYIKE